MPYKIPQKISLQKYQERNLFIFLYFQVSWFGCVKSTNSLCYRIFEKWSMLFSLCVSYIEFFSSFLTLLILTSFANPYKFTKSSQFMYFGLLIMCNQCLKVDWISGTHIRNRRLNWKVKEYARRKVNSWWVVNICFSTMRGYADYF